MRGRMPRRFRRPPRRDRRYCDNGDSTGQGHPRGTCTMDHASHTTLADTATVPSPILALECAHTLAARIGKSNGIFAPVSPGAHPRSPHRLDSASPLCPAALADARVGSLGRAARAMADAVRTPFPACLPAFPSLKYVLDHCTYVQYSQASFPFPPSPRCCPEGARMGPTVATYAPRDPSRTVLYHVIADHLETFVRRDS